MSLMCLRETPGERRCRNNRLYRDSHLLMMARVMPAVQHSLPLLKWLQSHDHNRLSRDLEDKLKYQHFSTLSVGYRMNKMTWEEHSNIRCNESRQIHLRASSGKLWIYETLIERFCMTNYGVALGIMGYAFRRLEHLP